MDAYFMGTLCLSDDDEARRTCRSACIEINAGNLGQAAELARHLPRRSFVKIAEPAKCLIHVIHIPATKDEGGIGLYGVLACCSIEGRRCKASENTVESYTS